MAGLTLQNIRKEFGRLEALRGFNLNIESGEFFSVLGPSGCGKTTLLRLIAGFERLTSGSILLDSRDIAGLPPQDRQIGMVFQNYALFPHMTVGENVAYGLKARKMEKTEIQARVDRAVASVGLEARTTTLVPFLSGGEQQRVALARAMVLEPQVLLCDEPLSNLDVALRMQMRGEIRALQRRTGITTIYVTHDQTEAMGLSDHVAVLNEGRLEQAGTPEEVYRNPATPFVAGFLGSANIVEGEWDRVGHVFTSGALTITPPRDLPSKRGKRATIAVKPEAIRLRPSVEAGANSGVLEDREYLGFISTAVVSVGRVATACYFVEQRVDTQLETRGQCRSRSGLGWLSRFREGVSMIRRVRLWILPALLLIFFRRVCFVSRPLSRRPGVSIRWVASPGRRRGGRASRTEHD